MVSLSLYPSSYLGYPPPIMAGRIVGVWEDGNPSAFETPTSQVHRGPHPHHPADRPANHHKKAPRAAVPLAKRKRREGEELSGRSSREAVQARDRLLQAVVLQAKAGKRKKVNLLRKRLLAILLEQQVLQQPMSQRHPRRQLLKIQKQLKPKKECWQSSQSCRKWSPKSSEPRSFEIFCVTGIQTRIRINWRLPTAFSSSLKRRSHGFCMTPTQRAADRDLLP
mmetsp:Transcript_17667/g.38954  ORF Transcript_17667/g.38954 Transcript_17667/m.38954 type:complete len:223 (+) Transcript_17667:869-1537(+)